MSSLERPFRSIEIPSRYEVPQVVNEDLPSLQLSRALSLIISEWLSTSTSEKEKALDNFRNHLCDCSPTAYANISLLALHSFSHLLSRDSSFKKPDPCWSRHPRYSEPLVISLLKLFYTCLTPHLHLSVPEPSTFVQLFTPDSTNSTRSDEQQKLVNDERIEFLDVLRNVFEEAPSSPFHFALAFLISELHSLATDEPAILIRRLSLHVLAALANVIDGPLLAAFLPGSTNVLVSILARSPRLHSALALPALDMLRVLIVRTFPPTKNSLPQKANPDSVADALKALSLAESAKNPSLFNASGKEENSFAKFHSKYVPESLRVTLDAAWASAAAEQLRIRLAIIVASRTGLRLHSMASVRIAFIRFVADLLDQQHLPLDAFHIAFFKFALIEACAHPIPIVAHEASCAMRRFVSRAGFVHFERSMVASLRFGGYSKSSSSTLTPSQKIEIDAIKALSATSDEEFTTNLCSGCLFVMVPFDEKRALSLSDEEFLIPARRLPSFLNRIGVIPFVHLLLFLHESVWCSSRVNASAISDALQNRVLVIARCLGKLGLLSCVYDALLAFSSDPNTASDVTSVDHIDHSPPSCGQGDAPDRNVTSFKKRAHAALLACAVVKGALCANDPLPLKKSHETKYVHQCAKEVLEGMSKLFLPSMKHATLEEAREIDDTTLALKLALLRCTSTLLDDLSAFQKCLGERPIGSDVVLLCLLNLLRDVSHGEISIREEAHKVLLHVSHIARCKTDRDLIMRHLNYVIARIIRNLHESWSADVLQYVIGNDGDEVSNEATLLLQRTLKGISDGLAGASDERALLMLSSMRSVLFVACVQKKKKETERRQRHFVRALEGTKQPSEGNDSECKQRSLLDEFAVVNRALMYYCSDRVQVEGEPLREDGSINQSNDFDDSYDSDDSDDSDGESDKRDAFEEVAENALDGVRDILVGRPWNLRASALECATLAVRLLKGRKKLLLPHVAKLLPLLPNQFASMNESLNAGERMIRAMKERKARRREDGDMIGDLVYDVNQKGTELPIVQHSCLLLSALAECAGSFIKQRFITLIFPKMRPLLRLCHYFPTLLTRRSSNEGMGINTEMIPSHGAMEACDACLEAFASIAEHTPTILAQHARTLTKFLSVFMDERNDPESGSNRIVIIHTNRSMVRFEKERWTRRVHLAQRIISSAVEINSCDSFCSLLCADERGPDVLHGGHEDLHDVIVRLRPITPY